MAYNRSTIKILEARKATKNHLRNPLSYKKPGCLFPVSARLGMSMLKSFVGNKTISKVNIWYASDKLPYLVPFSCVHYNSES